MGLLGKLLKNERGPEKTIVDETIPVPSAIENMKTNKQLVNIIPETIVGGNHETPEIILINERKYEGNQVDNHDLEYNSVCQLKTGYLAEIIAVHSEGLLIIYNL